MKTTDILSAVRRADKNYIEEASESNVTEKFEKKSFKKVFSAVASSAALAALAAFIVLTVSLANKRNDINPAANGTVGMLREWIGMNCPIDSRQLAEMMYTFSKQVLSQPDCPIQGGLKNIVCGRRNGK